jgi:hypothetical protein
MTNITKIYEDYEAVQNYRILQSGSAFAPTSPQIFAPSPYLKKLRQTKQQFK